MVAFAAFIWRNQVQAERRNDAAHAGLSRRIDHLAERSGDRRRSSPCCCRTRGRSASTPLTRCSSSPTARPGLATPPAPHRGTDGRSVRPRPTLGAARGLDRTRPRRARAILTASRQPYCSRAPPRARHREAGGLTTNAARRRTGADAARRAPSPRAFLHRDAGRLFGGFGRGDYCALERQQPLVHLGEPDLDVAQAFAHLPHVAPEVADIAVEVAEPLVLPSQPRVARHRVPPVRHLDAGRSELAGAGRPRGLGRDGVDRHRRRSRHPGGNRSSVPEHAGGDAQGKDLGERMNAQSEQMNLPRERMAHLEGLLEAITGTTGTRVA